MSKIATLSKKLATNLVKEHNATGVNILHASGKDAQQSVFHFHIHIVPLIPFLLAVYLSFSGNSIAVQNSGLDYQTGPLYLFYQIFLVLYFFTGYILLFFQNKKSDDLINKKQVRYVLIGSITASVLAMVTDLIFPYLQIFNYTWMGPVFTLIMVASIFIAILRYRLFNIQVIISELFSFVVLVLLIVNFFMPENQLSVLVKSFASVIITVFLYLFIRAVYKIEKLATELAEANKSQENFIHLISHEVKRGLNNANVIFAEISEGSFDSDQKFLKETAGIALKENRKVVGQVEDVLRSTNFKTGKISYDMQSFDFKEALMESISKYKPEAEAKGLKLNVQIKDDENYTTTGDRALIVGHLFKNLIENAMNFTLSGDIKIDLSKTGKKIRFLVKDTGVGITPEDKAKLFTEGGHGKDSLKVNVHSTGYGLFITKQIVLAHHGKIWAESEGAGKGSTFFVELPVA